MSTAKTTSQQDLYNLALEGTKAEGQARQQLVECIDQLLRLEAYAPTAEDWKELSELDKDYCSDITEEMLQHEATISNELKSMARLFQMHADNEDALNVIRGVRREERLILEDMGRPLIPIEVGDGKDKRTKEDLELVKKELDDLTSYDRLEKIYKRHADVDLGELSWAEERSKKATSGAGKSKARKVMKKLKKDLAELTQEKEELRDKIKAQFSVLQVDPVTEEEKRDTLGMSPSPEPETTAGAGDDVKAGNTKRPAMRSASASPGQQEAAASASKKQKKA